MPKKYQLNQLTAVLTECAVAGIRNCDALHHSQAPLTLNHTPLFIAGNKIAEVYTFYLHRF